MLHRVIGAVIDGAAVGLKAMREYKRAASERSGSSTVPVLLGLVVTSKEPDRASNHTRMRLAPRRPLRTIVRHREQQARRPPGTSGSQLPPWNAYESLYPRHRAVR